MGMVTGNFPPPSGNGSGSMKQQFAIHMPLASSAAHQNQPISIWRRWKRLTSYAVGTRLHELHQKSVSHHSKHKKKHKNHHEQPNVDPGEEIELDLVPEETIGENEEEEDDDYPGENEEDEDYDADLASEDNDEEKR